MNPPVSNTPVLLGLVGQDIGRSRTPEMHMAEGEAQGLRLVYRLIDTAALELGAEALPDLLIAAERMGFTGLNVTHPFKQAVIAHLHELSDEAMAVGAVNTVLFGNGRRIGHNTDASGFGESFRRSLPDAAMDRVVQLGAGGAGAAVGYAALALGSREITIFDLDFDRARALADRLGARFGPGRARVGTDLRAAVATADGVINTTPVGMDAHPGCPIDPALLRPELWVAEIIYFPLETELLRHARSLGCRTIDGAGMAVRQAAAAFRLFTRREPDDDRMTHTFRSLSV